MSKKVNMSKKINRIIYTCECGLTHDAHVPGIPNYFEVKRLLCQKCKKIMKTQFKNGGENDGDRRLE